MGRGACFSQEEVVNHYFTELDFGLVRDENATLLSDSGPNQRMNLKHNAGVNSDTQKRMVSKQLRRCGIVVHNCR